MKELLTVTLSLMLVSSNISLILGKKEQRISELSKEADTNQKFLAALKSLSLQRVSHKISPEDYMTKLTIIREAVMAKKRAEEQNRDKEDIDIEEPQNIRNQFNTIQQPIPKQNARTPSWLDKMINILDGLMSKTYEQKDMTPPTTAATTTQDILTEIQKALCLKENDPTTTSTTAMIPTVKSEKHTTQQFNHTHQETINYRFDKPGPLYKHQTERDVSKHQDQEQTVYLPAHVRGMKQRPRERKEELGKSEEQDGEQEEFVNIESNPGYEPYASEKSYSEEEQWSRGGNKRPRGPAARSGYFPTKRMRTMDNSLKSHAVNQSNYRTGSDDQNNNDKNSEDRRDSVWDIMIMIMIAIVATQLCLLCFLLSFKDKLIASLRFKYGQIKVCNIPR